MQTLAKILPALLFAALAFLAPGTARAQDETLPSAESLFEAHVEAMGGRAALDRHRERTLHGVYRIVNSGEVQILTICQQAPDKIHVKLDAPAFGTTTRATDGEHTWGTNNSGSPFEVSGRERLELLDSSHFHGEASYRESYASYRTVGRATIAQRPAYRVQFETVGGLTGSVYFDAETKLVCARRLDPASANDPTALIVVTDYKEFEGVKLPVKQTQLVGEPPAPVVEIEFRWVEINAGDMPEFSPPESIALSDSDEG